MDMKSMSHFKVTDICQLSFMWEVSTDRKHKKKMVDKLQNANAACRVIRNKKGNVIIKML
jgi:hypothetical protein